MYNIADELEEVSRSSNMHQSKKYSDVNDKMEKFFCSKKKKMEVPENYNFYEGIYLIGSEEFEEDAARVLFKKKNSKSEKLE